MRPPLEWRLANSGGARDSHPADTRSADLGGMCDDRRRRRGIRADGDRRSTGYPGRGGSSCRIETAEESKQQEGEVPLAVAESEQPDDGVAEVVVQGSPQPSRGDPRSRHRRAGASPGRRSQVCPDRKGQAPDAAWAARRLCAMERGEAAVDRCPDRAPASADQVETRQEATGLSQPHAGYPGAAREGHRRRAADVRFLCGRGTFEGLRAQVPGIRQRARQTKAVGRSHPDREADRLSTLHRRHLRSGFRQRREGIPRRHGRQGARGAASREGAERGLSGELLADAIPPEVVTTLAVIEQTDDRDYVEKQARCL